MQQGLHGQVLIGMWQVVIVIGKWQVACGEDRLLMNQVRALRGVVEGFLIGATPEARSGAGAGEGEVLGVDVVKLTGT